MIWKYKSILYLKPQITDSVASLIRNRKPWTKNDEAFLMSFYLIPEEVCHDITI